MKRKTTGLILALCFFGLALCFADDLHTATANSNESKSKLTSGTERIKPTYISLVKFTEKGIQNAKQTTQRVAAWAAKVQSMGVTIKQMYWTLGEYDQVCIFEAPDDETAASVLLAADMLGNIRSQTMRAFSAPEMEKILSKVP
ncbi:MAG TPA: GYD domain-containing protein [Candidatus Udaeobacter sp.]|nr:GYD domain-containing protein [Candidatus Udaeobacter sp.]